MTKLTYLIPLFPLIGFLFNGLGRKSISKSLSGMIASLAILASFVISLLIFLEVKVEGFIAKKIKLFDFINTAGI
ncbi:MAG: NADH-quinone oxidoreductase subunit, partial [Bacteroidota bacterium]